MDQPIYWGERSNSNPNACQYVKESEDIKQAGGNKYSDGLSHPLNVLADIFGYADRVAAYQYSPKNAVGSLGDLPNGGAQLSISGDLMQNCNSLGVANQWGYSPNWYQGYKDARAWKTSSGFPKLDVIGFSKDHCLSPLVSYRTLRKSIASHRYLVNKYYGTTPGYSKGYWPAECAFSERIIKALSDEGIEWSVVANSHLSRTLNDYPNNTGTNGVNSDFPNKADKVATNGVHWWSGQIDGRGGAFAAPFCYTPHKAKYVDPNNGTEYKITVVPMCDLLSYKDGYSQQGTGDIDANIAPYNTDPVHPPLVLLAHDGDNAWGGGSSYYNEAVTGFSHAAAAKGYEPTTVQQYLNDHPVAATDVVHVEDGAWVNADSDWGHPQFINWLWPLYSKTTYRFDPNGWTEDARNWAVITAVENYVTTAEDLGGTVRIDKCTDPDATSTNAEKAWHFYFTTLNSGYMYYGKALDMEVKQTVGGNHAIEYAQAEINLHPGVDNTPPTIFNPQRFPYNPGAMAFGPLVGYKQTQMPSDFDVWTYVHDVSGVQSVVLKYRTDKDGTNDPNTNDNETYAGGAGVNGWVSTSMTNKVLDKTNVANDPEINFFMLPTAMADLYYAPVTGLTNALVDYYVEATDAKGNVSRSDIQHVWVGQVPNYKVTGVSISPSAVTIGLPATQQLTANILPTNATNQGVSWSTSNSAIATVSTTGLVTSVALGTATITTTTADGGFVGSCVVTVSNTPPPGFSVYFYKPSTWGTSIKVYNWSALPTGALADGTWPGVAMTNLGTGWYKYTFTNINSTNLIFNDGTNQSANLSRNKDGWYLNSVWYDADPSAVISVAVSPTTASLAIGGTQQLATTFNPTTATNQNVSWSTSNSAIATVSATGLVTAVAAGTATITVTTQDGSKTASSVITISSVAVTGVSLDATSATVGIGTTKQLTATITPANATNQNKTWASSNTSVATVSSTGLVTAIAGGTATITVTTVDGSKTASCVVTVSTNVAVTGVAVSPATATVAVNGTQQITPTVAPTNATNKTVTYSSSNTAVATVSATGLVTAVASGTATITTTTQDGAKTATTVITVPAPGFTVYYYKPSNWGTAIKIYWWSALPTGNLADGTWPGVAMTSIGNGWYKYTFSNISSTYMIFNDGTNQTANLSRNKDGWYSNATWYDSDPSAVTGVAVSPTTATVGIGSTQQLTATITPSSAINQNVSWSSSNTAVATVSSTGLVTGIALGTATITVTTTDGGKTATSAITVSTIPVTGVSVSPTTATIATGATQQLTATIAPTNASNKNLTWTSSNTAVATVSTSGLVTGVATGTVTITVATVDGNKIATATISVGTLVNYYRIKNRWQANTYLYDAGNGQVKYGVNPSSTDQSYQWSQVSVTGGYVQLQNRLTGNYMSNQNTLDYVECTAIQQTWWSAMWTMESTGDGWLRIRNRWVTTDLVNLENLKGYAQHLGAQNTYYSAMWQLETIQVLKDASLNVVNTASDKDVTLYPNPVTNNVLQVGLTGFEPNEAVSLSFIDINGTEVSKKIIYDSSSIRLNLPSGIYVVVIESKGNKITKKIVVE